MTSTDGPDGTKPGTVTEKDDPVRKVELLLVEALMHTLFEKGVLTKNDTLDIVGTVTEVTRGVQHEGQQSASEVTSALRLLERLYRSFELLEGLSAAKDRGSVNVIALRPPVHDDTPHFPTDKD